MYNFVKPPPVPRIWKRAAQAARYTISGVKPSDWMSPLQPLPPYSPIQEAWQYDRPVGYNLYYKPRGSERYSFDDLRQIARSSELVRLAIETRLDQVSAIKWLIKPKTEVDGGDDDPRIKTISDFLAKPDKVRDWNQWLRVILEELFVTDAVSIAKRYNRGKTLFALEPVDGSTIFPLIDQNGRQPLPPDPAFQQILKGVPKADYTSDELIYYVRKSQVNTPYGYSPVEQIITAAETDIERVKYQLAYFSEGTVPDAYITAPDGMTADKVIAYETHLNSLLAGNAAGRRQMPVLVHGMEIKSLKTAELKNEFDEWIARKICFAFSLPPTAFVRQLNRSTAQSDKERAEDEGLFPVLLYVKRLMDRIIREDFGIDDLEFAWDDNDERDPKVQAEIDCMYVNAGIRSRNEVRDDLGEDDEEGGDELLVTSGSGLLPLPGSDLDIQMKQEAADQAAQSQTHAIEQINAKTSSANADDLKAPGSATSKLGKKKQIRTALPFHSEKLQELTKKATTHIHKTLLKARDEAVANFKAAHKADKKKTDTTLPALADLALLAPDMEEMAKDGGESFLVELAVPDESIAFDVVNDRAVQYAKERGASLITDIDEVTRGDIAGLIAAGLDENIGMDAIADRLKDAYAFSEQRAGLIAKTEIANANQQGVLSGMQGAVKAGVKLKKEWLPDGEACDICLDNAADGPIDIDEEFSSGDLAPLAHPRCECTLGSEVVDESGEATDEEDISGDEE